MIICFFSYRMQSPSEVTENKTESSKTPPLVYACATMWHETRQEMLQLLKSLFRYIVTLL